MRSLLFAVTREANLPTEISITALRMFAGFSMALAHGYGKIPPPEIFVQGVQALGFPMPVAAAWFAAASEFGGGLLLGFGFLTRPAAMAVAFTMGVAAFGAHAADPFQKKEMAFLYLFIALVFVFRGASRISIDRFFAR